MQAFLLVVMIVVMESDKRGIVAGRGLSLYEGSTYLLRRYHGYVFSYIAIHQLWFHPWVRTQARKQEARAAKRAERAGSSDEDDDDDEEAEEEEDGVAAAGMAKLRVGGEE